MDEWRWQLQETGKWSSSRCLLFSRVTWYEKEQDHPTKPHTKKHSKLAGFQLPPGRSFRSSGGLLEATSFKANTASSCCLHFFTSDWVGCEKRGITCWPSNPSAVVSQSRISMDISSSLCSICSNTETSVNGNFLQACGGLSPFLQKIKKKGMGWGERWEETAEVYSFFLLLNVGFFLLLSYCSKKYCLFLSISSAFVELYFPQ